MKPIHVLLGMLLASAGLSCNKSINATTGGEGGEAGVVKARAKSKIKLKAATYDFGIMEVGQVGKHRFEIHSVGEEPLEVKLGKATCKCTIGGLTSGGKKYAEGDSLELKKGETASIELEWTPTTMTEMFNQSAVIHTSDPEQAQIQLTINGQVREIISLNPPEAWPMGTIDGDKDGEIKGVIGSPILKEFNILSITSTDQDSIVPAWKPLPKLDLERTRFKCGYLITVKIKSKDTIGRFNETLTIQTDARKTDKSKGLVFSPHIVGVRTGPVLIRGLPGVKWDVDAMRLSLDRFPAAEGKSASLLLYVGGLGDKELEVSREGKSSDSLSIALHKVESSEDKPGKNEQAKADPGRRKVYRLEFSVPKGKEPATHMGRQALNVKLRTNHKRMKTISFSVSFQSF